MCTFNFSQELQEDVSQRESRWGSAQSRLRLRIQSLEKENQELRSDLKMMEQTRLQLWQKQARVWWGRGHLMSMEFTPFPKKNGH